MHEPPIFNNTIMYVLHDIVHVGQPIAWCIADGASGEIVAAFLNSVNKRPQKL